MTPEQRNVYEQGLNAQKNNQYATAIVCYQKLLDVAKTEDRPKLNYLLGSCFLNTGNFDEARRYLHEAINVEDPSLDAINNLGVCYKAMGQIEIAEKIFKGIASRVSAYTPALVNLAEIKEQQDNIEEACLWYELAMRQNRDDFDVLMRLVNCLQKSHQPTAAKQLIVDALPKIPKGMLEDYYEILTNLSLQLKDYPAAKKSLQDLIGVDPKHAQAWCNLAWVCEHIGEFDQAIQAAQKAAEISPEMTQAWNNLGLAYRSNHDLKNAEKSFLHGLAIQADELISFNLGTTYLLEGNYKAGWQGYEHRFKIGAKSAPFMDVPLWQKESLTGKSLLVYTDQGFGDVLQFARFLPVLTKLNAKEITVVVPRPLEELVAQSFAGVNVLAEDDDLPEADYQVALSSLAERLGVTLENLNQYQHVWVVPEEVRSSWKQWASEQPSGVLKVGINWMGNPHQTRDYLRSCPFDVFSQLFDVPGIAFYSLAVDPEARQELAKANLKNVVDLGSRLHDFTQTAAAVEQMDLMITIDSALSHVAGSVGAKTWTLLSHTPDWRWHLNREDSPWYPSMTLLRQTDWNEWGAVISEVKSRLEKVQK